MRLRKRHVFVNKEVTLWPQKLLKAVIKIKSIRFVSNVHVKGQTPDKKNEIQQGLPKTPQNPHQTVFSSGAVMRFWRLWPIQNAA